MILYVICFHQHLERECIIILMLEAATSLSPSQLRLDATGEQKNTTLKRTATSKLNVNCNVGAKCGTCDEKTRQGKASFYTLKFSSR
jgi:hypothetical protein